MSRFSKARRAWIRRACACRSRPERRLAKALFACVPAKPSMKRSCRSSCVRAATPMQHAATTSLLIFLRNHAWRPLLRHRWWCRRPHRQPHCQLHQRRHLRPVVWLLQLHPRLRPNAPRHRRHQHPPVPVAHGLRLPQWPRDLRRLVLLPDLRQPDRPSQVLEPKPQVRPKLRRHLLNSVHDWC